MKDDHFEQEEDFHAADSKQWRKERKEKARRDRSKYKKTDLDKEKAKEIPENLKRGRVLSIMADEILIDENGTLNTCRLRGALKKEKTKKRNLIAVGDFAYFSEDGAIYHVEERFSILSRADNHKEHVIAVNIDQVLITASVSSPPLKPSLIDRYIIAAEQGNMDPVIVINKIDALDQGPEKKLLHEIEAVYTKLNYPFFLVSAQTGEGLERLRAFMQNKSSVFSGQSGTGKSSLINALLGTELKTGEVAEKTRKGTHTTTSSTLIPLEGGGFCVDTPGIKSFGLWELKNEEIQAFFPEIAEHGLDCKYPDCKHLDEPECMVKKAVESGAISRLRFDSYFVLITQKLPWGRSN